MGAIFFSVVIPLYNKQGSVLRAVDSVRRQTHKDFELIVINDGSTDDSLSIVEAVDDRRLTILDQKNSGVSVARNVGIQASVSNYVCLLDADDEWHPEFLDEIAALIKEAPEAALFCARYDTVDESGRRFVGRSSEVEGFFGPLRDFFKSFQKSRSLICSSNVCINKGVFKSIGEFPIGVAVGEDIYVWIKMALQHKVMFSSRILSTIYRDSENRTVTRTNIQAPYHLKIFLFDPKNRALLKSHKSLRGFILTNATVFAVYAAVEKNKNIALAYANALLFMHPLGSLMIYAATIAPVKFLSYARKLRDSLTTKRIDSERK